MPDPPSIDPHYNKKRGESCIEVNCGVPVIRLNFELIVPLLRHKGR